MEGEELEVTVTVPPENETLTEPEVETVTETAVEIAEIEANRDITIAAIHAETEQARIEQETEEKSELELCREEIASLKARMEQMEMSSQTLPEPLAEQVAEKIVETVTETTEELQTPMEPSSTEQFMPIQTAETPTEVSESVEEENVEAAVSPRRRFIAI